MLHFQPPGLDNAAHIAEKASLHESQNGLSALLTIGPVPVNEYNHWPTRGKLQEPILL